MKKKKSRSKWIKWPIGEVHEATYLPSGWYWVAYRKAKKELMERMS